METFKAVTIGLLAALAVGLWFELFFPGSFALAWW